MIFIYDRNEVQVKALDIVYELVREIGKFNMLEFECEDEIEKGYRAVIIDEGKPLEFIIVDSEYIRDNVKAFRYYCQDSIKELKGSPILDKRPQGSFVTALTSALEGTRWTLVNSGDYAQSQTQTNSFYKISVLEAILKVIKDYDIEWHTEFTAISSEITARKLVIGRLGTQANSRLEFGKNIQKFTRRVLPDSVITALYGYGKGEETESGGYGRRISFADINSGKEYVENVTAKNLYGIGKAGSKSHVFGFFVDENEEDKARLLAKTQAELDRVSQVQAEYTVEAANIFIDCHLGDDVPVLDEEINFSSTVRIIKVKTIDDEKEFTFGTVIKSFSESLSSEIKAAEQRTTTYVQSVKSELLSQINAQYFGQDGYNYDLKIGNEYGLPAGLYSFDKPIDQNPTKVIYVGAGKMLISNEKSPDGSWKWKTAATADGLVGAALTVGSVTSNKLAADVGQSLDLSSNTSIILQVKSEVTDKLSDPTIQAQFKGERGQDGTPGAKGDPGTPAIQWTISTDGYWVKDGVKTSDKAVGTDGIDGTNGVSITSMVPEYYLSTSSDSATGGAWSETPPTYKSGKYIWIRYKISKSDGSTAYTSKKYDAALTQANEAAIHAQTTAEQAITEITTIAASIQQTATDITLSVVQDYAKTSDLEQYKTEVQNFFILDSEGVNVEFKRLSELITQYGTELTEQKRWIRFIDGKIHIGEEGNPISTVYDNDSLDFLYNGNVVATFTNDLLFVRNLEVENQVKIAGHYAWRPGAYIESVGANNLTLVWISN